MEQQQTPFESLVRTCLQALTDYQSALVKAEISALREELMNALPDIEDIAERVADQLDLTDQIAEAVEEFFADNSFSIRKE